MKLLALAAAGVAVATLGVLPSSASAASLPSFDFSECPAPPAGADPGTWRCESFVSQGKLTIHDRVIPLGEMRLVFSEGHVGGQPAEVFGALHHAPASIPGVPGATIQLRYGGYSNFQGNDERRGELDVYAVIRHPLLPKACTIGTLAKPLHTVVKDDPAIPRTVVSQDPPTFHFGVVDAELALPSVSGCGPLGRLLDWRLGLPSAAGENVFQQESYVQVKGL